ncbi:MAG: DUF4962 domain-containing protein [Phycisphaerae bacterium]|jgi:hypothetical protein|nr:DUF4962 domain-containing protein [Phycisphaerae bacterium]
MIRAAGVFIVICNSIALGAPGVVDDSPGQAGEWGFRPTNGQVSETNPPPFVWRPQKNAETYEIQCSSDASFRKVDYSAADLRYNCHCPSRTLKPGLWCWRFRYIDKSAHISAWSKVRSFTIAANTPTMPMPPRKELLARIPKKHPRLFVRPEQLPTLRKLASGELEGICNSLRVRCDRFLKRPPDTTEPPKYPQGMKRGSDPWREIWWGNRRRTSTVLNAAATLGFTRLLTGNDAYGREAKRLLLAVAKWDPEGSTGYRYNDEAGMPYAYYFSRTYSFINDLLSEKDKALCRRVMTVRGREMYRHLARRHIWRPYSSHSNRAWHFLGEVGVAFLDEIPEAGEWILFAMNVFYNVYPVWCDSDGGWHEGMLYWSSYIRRFTWWADVMRTAMRVDAYKKPYFSKIGYYPMYLQPPGTVGGGFGDLNARWRSGGNRELMTILTAQARNGHWRWYVDQHGGPVQGNDYIAFVRGALPNVTAEPPDDLPSSRCFRGTGQAVLNSSLKSAADNVEIIFKSSPFGTQSHGYESNNSMLLYAFGERLLIRSGRRDSYGSNHHRNWMWNTKSTNCITVDDRGQKGHSASARGKITAFATSDRIDYVAGQTGSAYGGALRSFTRHILFIKPELVIIFDQLEAPQAASFEWHLHSLKKMRIAGQNDIRITNEKAAARVSFLAPEGLKLSLTDRFDPPPRPRIKLTEWHLTASTPQKAKCMEFVTVIRPYRPGKQTPPAAATLHKLDNGYAVEARVTSGKVIALLSKAGNGAISFGGRTTRAPIAAFLLDSNNKLISRMPK